MKKTMSAFFVIALLSTTSTVFANSSDNDYFIDYVLPISSYDHQVKTFGEPIEEFAERSGPSQVNSNTHRRQFVPAGTTSSIQVDITTTIDSRNAGRLTVTSQMRRADGGQLTLASIDHRLSIQSAFSRSGSTMIHALGARQDQFLSSHASLTSGLNWYTQGFVGQSYYASTRFGTTSNGVWTSGDWAAPTADIIARTGVIPDEAIAVFNSFFEELRIAEETDGMVQVEGINGVHGWVYAKDLNISIDEMHGDIVYVDVFSEDGVTVIDSFPILAF